MVVATEHQYLLVPDCDALRLFELLPIDVNLNRLESEIVHTQVLAVLDGLFSLVEASHNKDTFVKSAEDAGISRKKVGLADRRVPQY